MAGRRVEKKLNNNGSFRLYGRIWVWSWSDECIRSGGKMKSWGEMTAGLYLLDPDWHEFIPMLWFKRRENISEKDWPLGQESFRKTDGKITTEDGTLSSHFLNNFASRPEITGPSVGQGETNHKKRQYQGEGRYKIYGKVWDTSIIDSKGRVISLIQPSSHFLIQVSSVEYQ